MTRRPPRSTLFPYPTLSRSRVQASGPGGLSAYSNAASATTQAPPPPTAPSNLTAAAASSSQINLTWTASSGAVTSYLVERCQDPNSTHLNSSHSYPTAAVIC